MRPSASIRATFALLAFFGLLTRTAHALVTLNDGTDKIFVSGTFSMGYDSNLSSSAGSPGAFTYSSSMGIEYQRRAGLIGVNANIGFALNEFVKQASYDTLNPSYSVEFDKGTGRLTGVLTINAQRTSQADAAVNLYTTAWNYNVGLNLHYPVIERYSFALSLGYGLLDYTQTSGQPLVNLQTYSFSPSLFYILSETRDLFLTYRLRDELSSDGTSTLDDGVSLGVNGKVIWEINGSISFGYDMRKPHGVANGGVVDSGQYNDVWVNGSANWAANRRLSFTGALSRDFATTATNATTETTSGTLDGTYTFNARFNLTAGVGGGINQFLGPFGYLPDTTTERRDYYFTWHASANYTLNSHANFSLGYSHFDNWSNLSFATFSNNTTTFTFSTRW